MNKINWSKIVPHLIAVGVFLIVAFVYNKPALQGKVLQQSDVIHWKGMAENSFKYRETHGHFPLWTNSLFSGMPGYQIATDPKNPFNLIYIHEVLSLFLGKPFIFFFLLCMGFYFLSQVYGVDYRIGIMGALGYAYASFSSILVVAGHETQVLAMAYMPALLGAILLVYHKRYWFGAAFTALFTSLFVEMNHLQVTYYFLIVAAIMTIYYLVQWIRAKDYKHIIKALAIVAVTGIIGVACNLVVLATTYDFSKATMRNGVLNLDSAKTDDGSSTGLPVDYAFQWSFQKSEVFSMLVPNIYGGQSGGSELGKDSHIAKQAASIGASDEQAAQLAQSMPAYWGEQPFTSGPVYLGAIICFLFLFGLIYLKRKDKWWMLAASVLAIMMSWGRFFPGFNDFLFNHLPMYNKFRVPTYTLIIPQLLFPLLAVIALNQAFLDADKVYLLKKLKVAGIAMAGVFLIVAAMYSSFTYKAASDDQIKNYLTQITGNNNDAATSFYNALLQDRQSLFGADILRSLIFIALAFGCLWLYTKNKLKASYAIIAVLLLSSIDVLAEGRRYLSDDNFQTKDDQQSQNFEPSAASQQILQDTGYYRVFNIDAQGGPFNDALTSYFHNSVGGYNPAKLAIYQDLITYQLSGKLNINVLNMLNTKYVITKGQQGEVAQQNPGALGPVWFAKQVAFVKDNAAAMRALDNNNPLDSAIVEANEKGKIPFTPTFDSSAKIQLIKNDNDVITYTSSSNANQFAVFSEIYYERGGWKAYIDNKEVPIVRTDYVLRGLAIPAGNHQIRFEFKPASFYNTVPVAMVASAIVWLLLALIVFKFVRSRQKISQGKSPH